MEPEIVVVPANTIVVNTNLVARENSDFNIFHECVHAEWHYLFFMLQDMSDGDVAKMKMKEVEVEKDQDIDDPVHFLEIQANRGVYGLMMPVTNTKALFNEEIGKASNYRHSGELLQIAGRAVINKLNLPYFRVRARMIQLGHVDARGALNKVDREWIEPFAFDQEAWNQDKYTFIVSKYTVGVLYEKNADFRQLLDSRCFVYCDGHVVRNEPRFMRDGPNGKLLSHWANEHVDKCCLRFIRRYVPKYRGEYEHGKLYYDADYVKQTEFYLGDLLNSENVNEIQAEKRYKDAFPSNFEEGFDQLMRQNGDTRQSIADKLHMEKRTLDRWLADPDRFISIDFLTILCLTWKIPDWLSPVLFDRAHRSLSESDPRHASILFILRAMFGDGLEAANDYLVKRKHKPLSIA